MIEGKKILKCRICQKIKEGIHLKSYNLKICFDCFLDFFKKRVKETIEKFKMFSEKEKVAVAISGGKDSTALAKVLKDLGYKITLFHINCRIQEDNYSQNSQKAVEEFAKVENLPLEVLDVKEEIGIDIKQTAKISKKEICGVCGMIKRYLLNKKAKDFDVIVTGHTLDDEASSLLSSLIFWKEFLKRQWPILKEEESLKRKAKPLVFCFERETKLFCQILNLPYNPKPCPLRGGTYVFFKEFIHQLEKEMPSSVLNFYKGFLKRKRKMGFLEEKVNLAPCQKCGYLTVAKICSFCRLKEKIEQIKKC
ncbi:MAG: ATP-binding protein [Minisyncoccales bacterium]